MASDTIAIRDSCSDDVPAIHEIYAHHVLTGTASFELTPPEAAEIARRRAATLAAGYPYLVAEIGGRLAGYSYAGPYRPRPAYRDTVENSVYVADWAQRRGVARALLQALIAACAAAGRRQMIAVIGDSGHMASVRLHEALGFAHVGVLRGVGYKHDRWLDTVLMQRTLGLGDSVPPAAVIPA